MKARKRLTCGGILHFETIQGLLIKRDGVYSYRCPSCGHASVRKTMPVRGAKCRAPALGARSA